MDNDEIKKRRYELGFVGGYVAARICSLYELPFDMEIAVALTKTAIQQLGYPASQVEEEMQAELDEFFRDWDGHSGIHPID